MTVVWDYWPAYSTCRVMGIMTTTWGLGVVDTPMAYAARKRKQAAHRARAAQYRSGERVAARESFVRAELRWAPQTANAANTAFESALSHVNP
jgi:hypothetical protein